MFLKCGQRFLAYVMFDSFRVGLGHGIGNSQRAQESDDDFVATARFLGEFAAGICKKNGPVRLSRYKTVTLQALNGPGDRDVSDTESTREVDNAGLTSLRNETGDEFYVILGRLLRMLGTGATWISLNERA